MDVTPEELEVTASSTPGWFDVRRAAGSGDAGALLAVLHHPAARTWWVYIWPSGIRCRARSQREAIEIVVSYMNNDDPGLPQM